MGIGGATCCREPVWCVLCGNLVLGVFYSGVEIHFLPSTVNFVCVRVCDSYCHLSVQAEPL